MKVFISWSGERSRALANAVHDWLPLVLHFVEPWLSQADIQAGQRWADQVAKELEACNFGILCITHENMGSPWVLFEAGALAKSMQGSRLIPLLLDHEFRDIAGPLAQFQAKKIDRTGLLEMIQSLNESSERPAPDARVTQLFDALWPELEKKVAAIPKLPTSAMLARPQPEILEELVTTVRALDGNIRGLADEGPRAMRYGGRRMHPQVIRDVSRMLESQRGDPIAILMVASVLREVAPWMYELGAEAYRAAKDGTSEDALLARQRFMKAADLLRRHSFTRSDSDLDSSLIRVLLEDLDQILDLNATSQRESGVDVSTRSGLRVAKPDRAE